MYHSLYHSSYKLTKALCLSLLLLSLSHPAMGQEKGAVCYTVSARTTAGTGSFAPFWFTANRHGLASTSCNSGYVRATALRPFAGKGGFDWAYGADIAATYNHTTTFIVQQCYTDIRYNVWQLSLGCKEHGPQGKNERLSTGGMTWSGNARPIPQVRFGIDDYVSLPYIPQWAQVKGFISYGRMTDDRFQEKFAGLSHHANYALKTKYHEKSAFLRLGNTQRQRIAMELGLEMNAMFGGELWNHTDGRNDELLFDNPSAVEDYLKALIPLNGGEDSNLNDQRNAAGNHVGSLHAILNYKGNEWSVRGYYEHYFDSRCGMTPWNDTQDCKGNQRTWICYPWKDGLYGLEITLPSNPFVTTLVAEYNTTRDQCGSIHHSISETIIGRVYGRANYYYNSSYPSYHHYGMGIGTPLVYAPLYNADHTLYMTNNRMRAHHLGIEGQPTDEWNYRFLYTLVTTWGSYTDPLTDPLTTQSMLVETTWSPRQWRSWKVTLALAGDRGGWMGNNVGTEIEIAKSF